MIKWHEVTWYSRLGAMILFVGVIPVLSYYIGTQYELAKFAVQPSFTRTLALAHSITATSQTPAVPVTTNASASSTEIKVPFDPSNFSKRDTMFLWYTQYVTPSKDILSFGPPPNTPGYQNVNAGFEVYENGAHIGEIPGEDIFSLGFSPDYKYFPIKTSFNVGCAGLCQDFQLHLINMVDKKITYIPWPEKGDAENRIPYSEYFWWRDSHTFSFTFYFVRLEGGAKGTYYRISPREIWNYDIQTGTYKLVQTKPEDAS